MTRRSKVDGTMKNGDDGKKTKKGRDVMITVVPSSQYNRDMMGNDKAE